MNSQLQLNRIDYGIKHKYATQFLNHHKTSNYTRRTYLSHIRTWNSFIEDQKRNKHDFTAQFESIIKKINQNGYDLFPPIQISSSHNLVNGIHRLVACDITSTEPSIEYVDSPYIYDSNFFSSYQNPHDGSRFSTQLRDQLISTYIDSSSLNALTNFRKFFQFIFFYFPLLIKYCSSCFSYIFLNIFIPLCLLGLFF